mgnify:CR=1 FL=1
MEITFYVYQILMASWKDNPVIDDNWSAFLKYDNRSEKVYRESKEGLLKGHFLFWA